MKRILIYIYLPLAALYLYMSVIYPTDPETIARRHFSTGEAREVALSFAIPVIAIWLFAFIGAWRLKEYSKGIKSDKDGAAFMQLSKGMMLLAIYLPLRSLVKILLNYLAHLHPGLTTATNLIITYLSLLIPLVAYIYISQAARYMLNIAKSRISLRAMYVLLVLFSFVSATFCYATSSSVSKSSPSDWLVFTDYNVGVPLRIATIIVPYMFIWFVGLIAAYEIHLYQKHVKGVFYRQTFKLLSVGLTTEILASIFIQYLITITPSLRKVPTPVTLVVMFSALTVTAVAYVMIIRGIRRLKRLEEV